MGVPVPTVLLRAESLLGGATGLLDTIGGETRFQVGGGANHAETAGAAPLIHHPTVKYWESLQFFFFVPSGFKPIINQ